MPRISGMSRRLKARVAGVFYLLTFVTGIYALVVRGQSGAVAGLIAGACYLAVTLLFYDLFKPVNKILSAVAAAVSLAGIAIGPLGVRAVNPLVFFGVYCLLIGYLIYRSNFFPPLLGILFALSSVGWLTFAWPSFAQSLYPYNIFPGVIGEGALTVWLLAFGVKDPKGSAPGMRT